MGDILRHYIIKTLTIYFVTVNKTAFEFVWRHALDDESAVVKDLPGSFRQQAITNHWQQRLIVADQNIRNIKQNQSIVAMVFTIY